MDVLHPIVVDRIESFGYDPDTPIAHCLNGWPGQHLGTDEPLRGDARLHHGCAALAVAYGMLIRHHLDQIAGRLDIPDDVLATGISVLARVGPAASPIVISSFMTLMIARSWRCPIP